MIKLLISISTLASVPAAARAYDILEGVCKGTTERNMSAEIRFCVRSDKNQVAACSRNGKGKIQIFASHGNAPERTFEPRRIEMLSSAEDAFAFKAVGDHSNEFVRVYAIAGDLGSANVSLENSFKFKMLNAECVFDTLAP